MPKFATRFAVLSSTVRLFGLGAIVFLIANVSAPIARADNPVNVQEYLRLFHQDPAKVLNDRLVKLDGNGQALPLKPVVTPELRRESREGLATRVERTGPFTEIPSNERPEPLLAGMKIERRLNEMEKLGWTKSKVPVEPWSGSYWPTRKGGLGYRFSDYSFPDSTFPENYAYFQSTPSADVDVSEMSPSEKYDLLIGDASFALTSANWEKGLRVIKSKPDVPAWYGICHGWSPAAYLEAEPKHQIQVQAKDGRAITFYPADVKALASALWAEISPPVVFVGRKCVKDVPAEDDMGRVTDPECFNTNPGTWHLAAINRIASGKMSFVMDATFDSEVWNQPVASYKYNYFNPQTFESSDRLADAILPMEEFTIDKFKSYRSPRAKYIVGIAFDVTYISENEPRASNGPESNYTQTVRYIYDLELNADHDIIGGEWYSNRHPDFIWAPVQGYAAISYGEKTLHVGTKWTGVGPVPDDLLAAGRLSSPRAQPLAGVVKTLLEMAK